MIPGLAGGLLDANSPMAGQAFPQPLVCRSAQGEEGKEIGEGEQLLDDVLGPRFRLVVNRAGNTSVLPALRALAGASGLPVMVIVQDGHGDGGEDGPLPEDGVREREGLAQRWFAAAGVCGALVRPDHYVYGTFSTAEEAAALVHSLNDFLHPAPGAEALPVNAVQRSMQKPSLDAPVGRS